MLFVGRKIFRCNWIHLHVAVVSQVQNQDLWCSFTFIFSFNNDKINLSFIQEDSHRSAVRVN